MYQRWLSREARERFHSLLGIRQSLGETGMPFHISGVRSSGIAKSKVSMSDDIKKKKPEKKKGKWIHGLWWSERDE